MSATLIAAFFSLLIGGVLGLLGGGGGILAVPMLVYVIGVEAKPAIALSLFFVGATSLFGTALAARSGRVRWKLGAIFGIGSMAAAFVGGKLAHFVSEGVLLGTLATVMLVTALAMLRGRKEAGSSARPLALGRILGVGAGVGVVSGLVGAGGGFLIVPALTLFGGLAMHEAIGTSLFVIAMQSFAGFAGHISHIEVDARLMTVMTAAAVVGMALGSMLAKRVSGAALKRGFAAMVLVTGSFVLARQLPALVAGPIILAVGLLALFITRNQIRAPRLSPQNR